MRGFIVIVFMISMLLDVTKSFARDFGKLDWGASAKEVKDRAEASDLTEIKEGVFLGAGETLNRTAAIYYFIHPAKDELIMGRYLFLLDGCSINDCKQLQDEFNYFKNKLSQQYGKPTTARQWEAEWETHRTSISLVKEEGPADDPFVDISILFLNRLPELEKNLKLSISAYWDCLSAAADTYSVSNASAFEIAEAAQGKCNKQFSECERANQAFFLYGSYTAKESRAFVQRKKSEYNEMIIQRVIENRLSKEKK